MGVRRMHIRDSFVTDNVLLSMGFKEVLVLLELCMSASMLSNIYTIDEAYSTTVSVKTIVWDYLILLASCFKIGAIYQELDVDSELMDAYDWDICCDVVTLGFKIDAVMYVFMLLNNFIATAYFSENVSTASIVRCWTTDAVWISDRTVLSQQFILIGYMAIILRFIEDIPSPPLPLPSPPTSSPTYTEAPLGYKAVRIRLRAASPSTHHPLEIPSPPLLLPSTTQRDDLPKAEMSLRKRARFTAPTSRFEIRESSSTVAARQVGHTLAHTVDCRFIDTMDASIRAAKSRAMTAVGWSMTELQILLLLRGMMLRRFICVAWSHSKSRIQAMEAQIRALQRDVDKMPPKKRTATTTTTTPMTDAQIKALIAQGVADALA
ncbi:hypothetical protein Tco_1054967, partial [Tanacetum coccineum]